MKKYFIILTAFSIFTMSSALLASAKESSPQVNKIKTLDTDVSEKISQLSIPNENQFILATLRGEWNYSVTVWTDPSSKPEESTGTSVNEMILGDRFISMKSSGILNVGGNFMPFEANGLMGYDNIKKVFTSVWVDTLNPGMMTGSGAFDKKSNVINEVGNFTSSLDKAERTYHSELQFTDVESYKRIIFSKDKSGKEYKMMEFVFHKKK